MLVTHSSQSILYLHDIHDSLPCYNRLFVDWDEIAQIPAHSLDLEIDFTYCHFLAHNGVAFLGALLRAIEARGGQFKPKWDTIRPNIYKNLAQNGFLHDFNCDKLPWDGNSIPYRSDGYHEPSAIGDYLRYKWLGKGWVNVSEGVRDGIVGRVEEIYLNAFEHSQSAIGVFSCGQHYPKARQLQLTVVDFGLGIPANIRSLPQNSALTSAEALKWAFLDGNSTKQDDVCRGTGLGLLQDFVIKNHGNLIIFSNDGYVEIDDNGVRYENKCTNFSGTLVNIALCCDESYYCLASEVSSFEKQWF